MTDRNELQRLKDKARRAGRVCSFYINEQGAIDGVAYLDSKGPGRQKAGMSLDPLTFAEIERAKPEWWEVPGSHLLPKRRTFCY